MESGCFGKMGGMSHDVPSHRAFGSETDRSISLQREAHELFLEDLLYHQATRSLRTELSRAQTPGMSLW